MTSLSEVSDRVAETLPTLLAQYDVPAAAVGVLADGEVVAHAAGVLNLATGVEATPDSLFQIGSITKLWTSTLVMQLVDEGAVDLDATVRTHLPDFRVADEEAARVITVRHLLTHTSGFEGDIYVDTGVGDDCVEKYLGVLHDAPQLFAPGSLWSYNNAAFSVLGRLVEVLRGKPFDVCLREQLIAPLGITHAAPGPYEAIMFRAAMGHLRPTEHAPYQPAGAWALLRGHGPAGSMFSTSPSGLLAFAQMHLDDGRAADGRQVLAPGTAARMQHQQVELPDLGFTGNSWGLGFERFETTGRTIVGHDGATIGQNAFLRIVPDADVAVTVMANGGDVVALYADLLGPVLRDLAGVELPPLPVPPADPPPVDPARYLGTYSCDVADMVVTQDDAGRLWLDDRPKGMAVELGDTPAHTELVGFRGDSLIALEPDRGRHDVLAFLGDDGAGRAAYLHTGRAVARAVD